MGRLVFEMGAFRGSEAVKQPAKYCSGWEECRKYKLMLALAI